MAIYQTDWDDPSAAFQELAKQYGSMEHWPHSRIVRLAPDNPLGTPLRTR